MLNSGEVPNLFPADEYEQIIAAVRPKAKDHGIAEGDNHILIIVGPWKEYKSRLLLKLWQNSDY